MRQSGGTCDVGALLSALQFPPQQRSTSHLMVISDCISSWHCFRSLASEADEALWTDFSKSFVIKRYFEGSKIEKEQMESSSVCVLLAGRVKSLNKSKKLGETVEHAGATLWSCSEESDDVESRFLCIEETLVVVMDRDDYQRAIAANQDRKVLPFVKFISGLPFFSEWKFLALARLRPLFREVELCCHTVLYREGSPPHEVYIVRKGEIELLKAVKAEAKPSFSPRSTLSPKSAHVSILATGEILGLEEALGKSQRTHTAVCKSLTASLLCAKSEEFLKKVVPSSAWEQAKELLDSKALLRDEVFRGYEKALQPFPQLSVTLPMESSSSPKASLRRIIEFGKRELRASVAVPSTSPPPKRPISIPRLLLITASPARGSLVTSPGVIRSHSHRQCPKRPARRIFRKSTRLVAPTEMGVRPSEVSFDFTASLEKCNLTARLRGRSLGRDRLSFTLEGKRIVRKL